MFAGREPGALSDHAVLSIDISRRPRLHDPAVDSATGEL